MIEFILTGIVMNLVLLSTAVLAAIICLVINYNGTLSVLRKLANQTKDRHYSNNYVLLIPYYYYYILIVYSFFSIKYLNVINPYDLIIKDSLCYTDLSKIFKLN